MLVGLASPNSRATSLSFRAPLEQGMGGCSGGEEEGGGEGGHAEGAGRVQ